LGAGAGAGVAVLGTGAGVVVLVLGNGLRAGGQPVVPSITERETRNATTNRKNRDLLTFSPP